MTYKALSCVIFSALQPGNSGGCSPWKPLSTEQLAALWGAPGGVGWGVGERGSWRTASMTFSRAWGLQQVLPLWLLDSPRLEGYGQAWGSLSLPHCRPQGKDFIALSLSFPIIHLFGK